MFAAGFTVEAAEQICQADIDTLQSLVDKCLVVRERHRLRMLETIGEFASERLAEPGGTEELRRRHAEYFLEVGERNDATTSIGDRPRVFEELMPERDNFRSAAAWAIESGDGELALRLATVAGWFTVPIKEWDQLLARVLPLATDIAPARRLAALLRATYAAKETASLSRAWRLYEELLDLARSLRDTHAEALALGGMGDVMTLEGNYARGRELYAADIALLERIGAQDDVKYVLQALGEVEMRTGRLEEAEELLRRSIFLARGDGDSRLVAKALHSLGDVHVKARRLDDAERAYSESLETGRPFKDPRNAAYCLAGLAAVDSLAGDVERAGRLWGAVERIEESQRARLHAEDRLRYELILEGARAQPEFADGTASGRDLSLDDAIEYALSVD